MSNKKKKISSKLEHYQKLKIFNRTNMFKA